MNTTYGGATLDFNFKKLLKLDSKPDITRTFFKNLARRQIVYSKSDQPKIVKVKIENF